MCFLLDSTDFQGHNYLITDENLSLALASLVQLANDIMRSYRNIKSMYSEQQPHYHLCFCVPVMVTSLWILWSVPLSYIPSVKPCRLAETTHRGLIITSYLPCVTQAYTPTKSEYFS
jgi:hypothetical protein